MRAWAAGGARAASTASPASAETRHIRGGRRRAMGTSAIGVCEAGRVGSPTQNLLHDLIRRQHCHTAAAGRCATVWYRRPVRVAGGAGPLTEPVAGGARLER